MVTDQLDHVRIAYTGAAPISAELQKAVGAKMGRGSVFISQTWGMTEACGGCTHMPPYETDDYQGSVSPLMQNMLLRFVIHIVVNTPTASRREEGILTTLIIGLLMMTTTMFLMASPEKHC